MNGCPICRSPLPEPIYRSAGQRSLTTMLQLYDQPTTVRFCDQCGHLRTDEIVPTDDYYAHQYRILAETEDEDLLYAVVDGRKVFQVEHRVATLLNKVPLPVGSQVLDFGCAKGAVMRQLLRERPDIAAHCFDVTDRYVPFWQQFTTPDRWATTSFPNDWHGRFDLVCSFYVLEHVPEPVVTVQRMARLLKPHGWLYFVVPHVEQNPADLIVADHLQHYSENSLRHLLPQAGLEVVEIDETSHNAALLVVARLRTPSHPQPPARRLPANLRRTYGEMSAFWTQLSKRVRDFEQTTGRGRAAAIYGAGFYGNYVASCLAAPQNVRWFVDQNPHLHGRTMLDKPILPPEQLPRDAEVVYVGLNPHVARPSIAGVTSWRTRPLAYFYL